MTPLTSFKQPRIEEGDMGEYVCVFLSVDLTTDPIAIVNFGKGNHFLEGTQEQLRFLGFSFDSFPCCSVIVLSLSFCLVC